MKNISRRNFLKGSAAMGILAAMGGAGALMGSCVKAARIVCYEDLGCEAIRELKVENMPLTVVIDSQGNNLYKSGPEAYLRSLEV